MLKIRHGFKGERLASWPYYIINQELSDPLNPGVAVNSAGYFPKAEGHYIERPKGRAEHILIYCTKGSGWYEVDGVRSEVHGGQFLVIPAGVPHSYGASENNPWYIYWAHFSGPNAHCICQRIPNVQTITGSDDSRITERITLFDEILNIMERHVDARSASYITSMFMALISSFCYIDIYREAARPQERSKDLYFLSKAIHFMTENIDTQLTLKLMADNSGYSESNFYRLFFKETGIAPITYFLKLKMSNAETLLLDTDLSISQIALKLGYTDQYYFSRLFKKFSGQSPRNWRNSRRS